MTRGDLDQMKKPKGLTKKTGQSGSIESVGK